MDKNREPLKWQELSWEQIAKIRDVGIGMVILPVGQPNSTDCTYPLAYGCSLGHSKKWPGTLPLRADIAEMKISLRLIWELTQVVKDFLSKVVFGDLMFDAWRAHKRAEWLSYLNHVSDWERAQYLKQF